MHSLHRKAFTILELMVAITVFTIGFVSVYLLLGTGITLATQGRDEIIAANLLREQVELVKNLRDSNWIAYRTWDSIVESRDATTTGTGLAPGYYTIESQYSDTRPIILHRLDGFTGEKTKIIADRASLRPAIQVCRDSLGRYTHTCVASDKTQFSSYIIVEPVSTGNSMGASIPVPGAYRIRAVVADIERGYREYTLTTMITDWKQQ